MTTLVKSHTVESLLAFEQRVADAFANKQIRAPIHLSDNNAQQLIDIFKDVKENDWVFTTWRSHFHCLLKGIPEEVLFNEIVAGRSMFLNDAKHKIVASAIVGGILPIALGVALANKRMGIMDERVWVFVGDMTARTGIFHEFMQYSEGHALDIKVVVEDNGLSTNTPTEEVWGVLYGGVDVRYYKYRRDVPHTGIKDWVNFS